MKPERAWSRLQSGRHLDLLHPKSNSWLDGDLAVGLAWTYRWGGQSRWDRPLSVAQHSLLVLVLRQQMQPHQPLSRGQALRELLHDGNEGFLGFDPISPVKPHLGQDFHDITDRLQSAIEDRYNVPPPLDRGRTRPAQESRPAKAFSDRTDSGWDSRPGRFVIEAVGWCREASLDGQVNFGGSSTAGLCSDRGGPIVP